MKIMIATVLSLTATAITVHAQMGWKMQPVVLQTRWAKKVSPSHTLEEYPRPQMKREKWTNLNGLWSYAITKKDDLKPQKWDGKILVPYPIESALSGVQQVLQPDENLWYTRTINYNPAASKGKTLLHFGAVDWQATVYVNGKLVGDHTGGYTAFTLDITDQLKSGANELVVKVFDPSDKGIGPHGKQVLNPGNIYYTPTSGIWQTVWLENVPNEHIEKLIITPDIEKSLVKIKVNTNSTKSITITFNSKIYKGKGNEIITVPVNDQKLWSPEHPYLYRFAVKLGADEVSSYFGMRKVAIQKDSKGIDRITLNNKPYYNLGTLDQGFWPEGLYTAPTDEALAFDIKAIKAMGFNTIRKHIKVEPAKWYYDADKIGVLVWQDLVDPNQGLPPGSKPEFEKESKEILEQLHNYPSITTWVVFNEEWGAYDQKRITQLVKDTDPTRIINGHSGGFLYVNDQKSKGVDSVYVNSDMTDIHSYPNPMMSKKEVRQAQVCGEFGGVGVSVPGHEWNDMQGWGYVQATPKELIAKYTVMVKRLSQLKEEGLSGSIYTQPFDVEGEENGLMTYDREIIKMPLNVIRNINSEIVKGSPLPANFIIAKNIDQDDTDEKYPELLKAFVEGKSDSAFLRRLTLMAIRKKDQPNLSKIGGTYISQLKHVYTNKNLNFIFRITNTTNDLGFNLFMKDSSLINKTMNNGNFSQIKLRSVIGKQEIEPFTTDTGKTPDWQRIDEKISKYGYIGQEALNGAKMNWYLDKEDWENFAKNYILYYSTALPRSQYSINNMSWIVFQHIKEPSALQAAIKAMKFDLEKYESKNGIAYDTYANLLFKVGKKNEAIKIETQALKLNPNEKGIQENLKKMLSNQETW